MTDEPSLDDTIDASLAAAGGIEEDDFLHDDDTLEGGEDAPEQAMARESGQEPAPAEPQSQPQGQPAVQGQQQAQPLEAPHHWDVESQDMFRRQTPEVQAWLMNRDHAMTAAHTRRSQAVAPYTRVAAELGDYISRIGDSPDQYLLGAAQIERTLRTGTNEQKMSMLADLAERYGVTFEDQGASGYDPDADPLGIQYAQREAMRPYQERIDALEHYISQSAAMAEAEQTSALQDQVESYRTARDDQGNLIFPYFDEVRADMAEMARSSPYPNPNLTELYERACWANPSVRAKMQAAHQYAVNQAQQAAAQRRSAATGGLQGVRSGEATASSWEEAAAMAMDELSA